MRQSSIHLSTRPCSVEHREEAMANDHCLRSPQVPYTLSSNQAELWRHILSFMSFPMKHSVSQYLKAWKILGIYFFFFHMSQWVEEVLPSPWLQTGNLGTETLRSKASINFAPWDTRDLMFLSSKHYTVFNMFKVQLPITTAAAASTEHFCKSDPRVSGQALRQQKAHSSHMKNLS